MRWSALGTRSGPFAMNEHLRCVLACVCAEVVCAWFALQSDAGIVLICRTWQLQVVGLVEFLGGLGLLVGGTRLWLEQLAGLEFEVFFLVNSAPPAARKLSAEHACQPSGLWGVAMGHTRLRGSPCAADCYRGHCGKR